MKVKKTVKRIGKYFFTLEHKEEEIISQSILILDNGYTWLGHLDSAIEQIENYFPKAEISVLTFEQRVANLQQISPSLKFILPSQRLRPRRYQLALQLLKLRKARYDFIFLFSLDITPLIISLLFFTSKVILYNQWGQWWTLRLRNIKEVFKITYAKKKARFRLKHLIKMIGLFFVLLQREDENALRHSILVVDNGYSPFGQIEFAIQRIKDSFPKAKVSILALQQRNQLIYDFPAIEIIKPGRCIIKRYRIARHLLRLRKNRYDYIILLSLDVSPIIISILFMNCAVLLNNQWHQWWLIKPKSMKAYLMIIPRFILNIIIFAYLLFSVSWMFFKRLTNIFRYSLSGKKA